MYWYTDLLIHVFSICYLKDIFHWNQNLQTSNKILTETEQIQGGSDVEGRIVNPDDGRIINPDDGLNSDSTMNLVRKLSDNPVRIMSEAMTYLRGRTPTVPAAASLWTIAFDSHL